MNHEHHHCQNCGANFETEEALDKHADDCKRQQSLSGGIRNSGEIPSVEKSRKGREFTRSHKE